MGGCCSRVVLVALSGVNYSYGHKVRDAVAGGAWDAAISRILCSMASNFSRVMDFRGSIFGLQSTCVIPAPYWSKTACVLI